MLKNKLLICLLLGSLLLAGVGYYLTSSYEFGLCYADAQSNVFDVSCHRFYERLGDPLLYGGGALAIVFALLYAFPQTFSAWKKFAIWFVPLAALLFIFYPDPGSGDFLSPMPEQLFQWVSVLFIVISALIIGVTNRKI